MFEAKALQDRYRTVFTSSEHAISKVFNPGLHKKLEPLYTQYKTSEKETNSVLRAAADGFKAGFNEGLASEVISSVKFGKGKSISSEGAGKFDINVKPNVSNPKMKNIVNDIYKGQGGANTIGNGTTMDAVRNEVRTGLPTNGKFHSIKAQETINRLQRRLRAGDLNQNEMNIANELIKDLQSALIGK